MPDPVVPDPAVEAFNRGYDDHPMQHERPQPSDECCVRAGLVAAYPHLFADLLREIADEIEREGGDVLTATWASDVLRERADRLAAGSSGEEPAGV